MYAQIYAAIRYQQRPDKKKQAPSEMLELIGQESRYPENVGSMWRNEPETSTCVKFSFFVVENQMYQIRKFRIMRRAGTRHRIFDEYRNLVAQRHSNRNEQDGENETVVLLFVYDVQQQYTQDQYALDQQSQNQYEQDPYARRRGNRYWLSFT